MPKWYEEQVGPLPLGIWLVAGVGGVGLAYYEKRKTAATNAAATAAPAGGLIPTDQGGIIPLATGTPSSTLPATSTPTKVTYTDNVSWENAAINVLVSRGYDPYTVSKALTDYLNGSVGSQQEQSIVSVAISAIGPPPFPPTILPTPPPTNGGGTPTPTPVQAPTITIDTLVESTDGNIGFYDVRDGHIHVGLRSDQISAFRAGVYNYIIQVTPDVWAAILARYGSVNGLA